MVRQGNSGRELYAIQEVAAKLANSQQPLVPERLSVTSQSDKDGQSSSTLGTLLQLLVAEKSGWSLPETSVDDPLSQFADQMSQAAIANMQDVSGMMPK